MARDPDAAAVEQMAPEFFTAKAAELGTTPAQLTDVEHRHIAAEWLFENKRAVYAQARRLEGDVIDVEAWPEWAQRFAAKGGTLQTLTELADASEDAEPKEARRRFNEALATGKKMTKDDFAN